ncbi:hypothetical protein Tco_0968335 [Tanacetum coccineum]
MGDKNSIRTLGDYSKPSYKGYRNTIELPVGNNVVPLRSDTIRLVQNGCSFHELRYEDLNQHLKDFLKLVDSLDLDGENKERTRLRLFQFSLRGQASNWLERLPARSITTCIMENLYQKHGLVLRTYYKKSLIMASNFGSKSKFFMTMSIPSQDEPLTNRPVKITTSCEICSGPHDTQYSIEDSEQAFVEYVSLRTDEAGGSINAITIHSEKQSDSYEKAKENKEEGKDSLKNIHVNPSTPPDLSVAFITEKVLKFNSFVELLGLVLQSFDTEVVCTKGTMEKSCLLS